jgi:hypothetical protein
MKHKSKLSSAKKISLFVLGKGDQNANGGGGMIVKMGGGIFD